jgi:hypothetical protein
VSWVRSLGRACALAAVFALVQTGWLGLLPGTAGNVAAQAIVLATVGLLSIREGPVMYSFALLATQASLLADEATIALGLPQITGLSMGQWITSLAAVGSVWASFPVVCWVFARPLPERFRGIGVSLALLALPFVRYPSAPEVAIMALAQPRPGSFVLLPVPWALLIASTAALAVIAGVAARSWITPARAVAAVSVGVLVLPILTRISEDVALTTALDVRPTRGGALTEVRVIGRADGNRFRWDGEYVRQLPTGPTELRVSTGRVTTVVLPGLQDLRPGSHMISLDGGAAPRSGIYELQRPDLDLRLDAARCVEAFGSANEELRVLVLGPDGPEYFAGKTDPVGMWRSARCLPAGSYTIVIQIGERWGTLTVPTSAEIRSTPDPDRLVGGASPAKT